MVASRTLTIMIIASVALVLSLIWMSGGFDDLSGIKEGLKGYVPDFEVGKDKIAGKKVQVPVEHNKAITKLVSTIKSMLESKRTECFMNYRVKDYSRSGLPILQEKGTVISLSKDSIGIESLGGKQIDIELTKKLNKDIKGFKPCVIAGEDDQNNPISANFYFKYLATNKKPNPSKYHQNVGWLSLYYSAPTLGFNHNRIDYPITKDGKTEKKTSGLEDGGWLYLSKDRSICFFPSVKRGNTEDGLNNNYLGDDQNTKNSIGYQVSTGNLKLCGKEGEWKKYWWVELMGDGENPKKLPIRGKCPGGLACHTYQSQCNKLTPSQLKGCALLATDTSQKHCATGEAKIGSLISRSDWKLFRPLQGLGKKRIVETIRSIPADTADQKNLAKNFWEKDFQWHISDNYPLVCGPDRYWYECNELSKGKKLELNNYFAGSENPIRKITVTCREISTKKYRWEAS